MGITWGKKEVKEFQKTKMAIGMTTPFINC
jgi:hypothetical protein